MTGTSKIFILSTDKPIANLPDTYLHARLYNSCNDYVQTSLINFTPNFMTLSEDQLLTILKNIVTHWSNPAIYHLKFSSITQSDNGPIKDFVIHLRSSAPDYEFTCSQCNYNLQDIDLKDQLIKGINIESHQTDILAKANQYENIGGHH